MKVNLQFSVDFLRVVQLLPNFAWMIKIGIGRCDYWRQIIKQACIVFDGMNQFISVGMFIGSEK